MSGTNVATERIFSIKNVFWSDGKSRFHVPQSDIIILNNIPVMIFIIPFFFFY